MCGIFGINENNALVAKKATQSIKYRGPDYTGFYFDANISLGHNRLSILDLNPRSNQPMSDPSGNIQIIFNGEIFNFKELRDQLSASYDFKTTSDTEVLVNGYLEFGKEIVSKLKGMFAFAVYDKGQGKIFLFRDSVGIKPCYYFFDGENFIFSSEVKAILIALREKGITAEVDISNLDYYFSMGFIPAPHTLYKNVYSLLPSHVLEYDLSSNRIVSIESFRTDELLVGPKDEKGFFNLISKKILDHLVSDVPVGVFFSGGTDSSIIAAILHSNNVNLKTYSIKMDHKAGDEKYYTAISHKLGLKSSVTSFGVNEFDSIYEAVTKKIDQPISDSSIFPTYFVSKESAKEVKVVLSGEGGDEYFMGYERHKILLPLVKYRDYNVSFLDKIFFSLPRFKGKTRIFSRLFVLFKQPLSYYFTHLILLEDFDGFKKWKNECKLRGLEPTDLDRVFFLGDDLLRKIDFATSLCSIEGRVPLLDSDIIANALVRQKDPIKDVVGKQLLKKMLCQYLPKELVYRPKSGFGLHPSLLFEKSKLLYPDYLKAMEYLRSRGLLPKKYTNDSSEIFLSRYPNAAFAIVMLWHALNNFEKGWEL